MLADPLVMRTSMGADARHTLPWVGRPGDVVPICKVEEDELLGHGEERDSM